MDRPPVLSYMPPGDDPFAPGERAPDVLVYFRAYCVLMALLAGAGALFLTATVAMGFGPSARKADDWVALAFCMAGVLFCVALGGAHVLGAVAPRRPWMHTFGTLLLVSSFFVQGCCFPFAVVLLVQWTKPPVKAWFAATPPA